MGDIAMMCAAAPQGLDLRIRILKARLKLRALTNMAGPKDLSRFPLRSSAHQFKCIPMQANLCFLVGVCACDRSETILPMVKQQVESQIKVRDFSQCSVAIAPAEYGSWSAARTELMAEAKVGLKARLESELSTASSEEDLLELRTRFSADERALEHDIDHQVHTFSACIDVDFNFLSQ
jgi:hypothetical protein